jgi:hypothetical protein
MNARVFRVQPVLRRCDECGALVSQDVMPGLHAPHYAETEMGTALVNCVGEVLVQDAEPGKEGER